jgi:trimeric autotransporter adhesin
VDSGNDRIRKVTPDGMISTVVGNGKDGFGGDGGKAASAQLNRPRGVSVDSFNLYIADSGNDRIRKVTPDGMISTVAGKGKGISPSNSFSGDGGKATSAQLNFPMGIAVDSVGNLYIADSHNDRIRKVTHDGTISTVAGNGLGLWQSTLNISDDGGEATSAWVPAPSDVAVDSAGNLYIPHGNRVSKISPDGVITTIAGGHAFRAPYDMAVDSDGNIYLADEYSNRIRKVTPDGASITIAGNGTRGYSGDGSKAVSAQLAWPRHVAVDAAGNIYIAGGGNRIRKVTADGVITTIAGNGKKGYSGDGGPATSAQISSLTDIAADSKGNLYFTEVEIPNIPLRGSVLPDLMKHRVRKVSSDGVITTIAATGTSVAVDSAGNLYIADRDSIGIRKYTSAGLEITFPGNWDEKLQAIAVDSAGNLYVVEEGNHCISKITPAGVITTVAGNGTAGFSGDGGPAASAQLRNPTKIAVDAAGNLYILDNKNNRIRKVFSASR